MKRQSNSKTKRSLLVECDGVVVAAELGGVGAHENITNNDVLEVFGEVRSHNAHDALSVLANGLLEDVIFGGEHVVLAVEGEGDVGEGVKVRAVLLNGDAFEERLEESVGSHNEGGAGVDSGLVASDIDVAVGSSHFGEVQIPVALLNDIVSGNRLKGKTLIDAWNGHVGFLRVVLEVKGEGLLRKFGLGHECGEFVH